MIKKIYISLLFAVFSLPAMAQAQLEEYLFEGLESNLTIRQQQFAFEKSVLALKEARTLFLPRVNFETDYFLARGGRTVDFPAGDLLNPIFNTLNQLTESQAFPLLENERILLNPNNFYDARIRTTLPVFHAELGYNRRIKADEVSLSEFELLIYKRELVKDIKTAYFNYLKAREAERIFESALQLARESNRINESLFENGMVNKTVLVRAANEVIRYENELEAARQQSKNAKAYFNFLLNRDLGSEIIESDPPALDLNSGDEDGFFNREELNQLKVAAQIDRNVIGLSRSYLLPKISAFLDLGSQGFDWKYNNNTQYYFFGLSTRWNIFSGGQHKINVRQAKIDGQVTKVKTDQAEEQLKMALLTGQNNYLAAYNRYLGTVRQLQSAKRAYDDAKKLYASGQLLFIELLDAQNQLVSAQLQQNISLFDCHIRLAEIERANASFNLYNN